MPLCWGLNGLKITLPQNGSSLGLEAISPGAAAVTPSPQLPILRFHAPWPLPILGLPFVRNAPDATFLQSDGTPEGIEAT